MKIKQYIINLDKYPEKFERTSKNLSKLDFFPERFKAVYGKDLDPKYVTEILAPSTLHTLNEGRNLDREISTLGAVGCYLSHISVWREMIENDIDVCFIFEDDAVAASSSKTRKDIDVYLKNLPDDWDFAFIGFNDLLTSENDIKIKQGINKVKSVWYGLQSYVINKSGAQKLLKRSIPITDQLDSYICYMAMYDDLNAYKPDESFVDQDNLEGSSIQTFCPKCFVNRFDASSVMVMILTIFLIFLYVLFLMARLIYRLIKNKN